MSELWMFNMFRRVDDLASSHFADQVYGDVTTAVYMPVFDCASPVHSATQSAINAALYRG